MNIRIILTTIIFALFFLTTNVSADILRSNWVPSSNSDNQIYLGAAFGKVSHGFSDFEQANNIELLMGYDADLFSLEASYLNLVDMSTKLPPKLTRSIYGYTVGGTVNLPISSNLQLHAKAGVYLSDSESEQGGVKTTFKNNEEFFYGFGGMYAVSKQISIGARYMIYNVNGADYYTLQAQVHLYL